MSLKEKIVRSYLRTNLKILSALSRKRATAKALKLFCTPFNGTRKIDAPLFDKAEKLQFRIDGKMVTGYRWNYHRSKKFLILHGFHSTARKFESYISPMLDKGYEVIAFDAPAHGESEGKQVTVLDYKKLIKEICTRYGPIDAFLAHSFGGLAISLALEEIPHSEKTKLVLIAPVTETSSAVDLLFDYLNLKSDLREDFEQLIISKGGVTVQWLAVSRAIKNIKARILWVHDEDDDITPINDVKPLIAGNYPNIKFLITKGLGHRRVYRQQEVVDTVLDFFE